MLLVRPGSVPVAETTVLAERHTYSWEREKHGLTKKFEVAFASDELIETDIGLEGDTRSRISEVGIITGYDRKPLALRLPREVRHCVYSQNLGSDSVKHK